jgi:hypothetical protein
MTALTVVVVLLALSAIALPPIFLVVAGRGLAGAWMLLRNGGPWTYLVVLADLACPAIVATVGAFALRGRRVPDALLFAAAGGTFAVALFGAWMGQRRTINAIMGESVDPEMKSRILAEGISETMSNDIFGGFVACGIALVAVAGAASVAASIDTATASRGGPKPPAMGAIGAGAAGGAWVLATIVLGGMRLRDAGASALLPVLPLFVIVPFAVLAGRGAGVLRAWHDRAEAARVAGATVVAGASAILAMLAFQRALESGFAARALGAIAGESVDPSQQARILGEAVAASRLGTAAYAMHAVFASLTFGLALAPSIGNGRHPASPNAIATVLMGVALAGGTLSLAHSRTEAARLSSAAEDSTPSGVTLPVLVGEFSRRGTGPGYGPRLVLSKDTGGERGINVRNACGESGATTINVYADRAATLSMLRDRLGSPASQPCVHSIVFFVRREHPPDVDARLGDYAGFLGHMAYVNAVMDVDFDRRAPTYQKSMRVVQLDDAVEIDGTRVALPIAARADDSPYGYSERISVVRYVFRPTDTVERMITTITAVEAAYGFRLDWTLRREIDDGARPPPPPPPALTGGSSNAVMVNGRLPPEVIQRIVKQHLSQVKRCYEKGLVANPNLQGQVRVKFIIDRSGSVSSAYDGGSDIGDKGVVQCVVHVFESMSFPEPEGGIVTVVYPFSFQPAK